MDFEFNNYPHFEGKGAPKCTETDPELFFPDPDGPNFYQLLRHAKEVCSTCPYQLECLQYAVEYNGPGVWGGTTENERRQLKRKGGPITLPTPTVRKRWSGK